MHEHWLSEASIQSRGCQLHSIQWSRPQRLRSSESGFPHHDGLRKELTNARSSPGRAFTFWGLAQLVYNRWSVTAPANRMGGRESAVASGDMECELGAPAPRYPGAPCR